MAKEYIPLFLDFNETTVDLTDEECGRLVRAIIDYANDKDYEWRIVGAEKIAFRFLKGLVDRNQAISAARAKAGSRKSDQSETSGNNTEQTETNGNKTKQNETKFPIETEKETKSKKIEQEQKQERFARFWSAYPRHVAKSVAQKAFEKINPDEELLQIMIEAISRWKRTAQWKENGGQFIPHPSTWLNQHRWEDELPVESTKSASIATGYQQRDNTGAQDEAIEMMRQMIRESKGEAV